MRLGSSGVSAGNYGGGGGAERAETPDNLENLAKKKRALGPGSMGSAVALLQPLNRVCYQRGGKRSELAGLLVSSVTASRLHGLHGSAPSVWTRPGPSPPQPSASAPEARPQGCLRWVGAYCVDFAGPAPTAFTRDSPGGSDNEESACDAGDPRLIHGLGRSPGGGHGDPLQCPCLENPMERGAWWATVHGVAKSRT